MSARRTKALDRPRRSRSAAPRVVTVRRGGTVLIVGTLLLSAATGSATAYWQSTGTGTGSATTGTTHLTADADPVAGLYPGATVPIEVRVTNDDDADVALSSVVTGAVTAAPVPGCAASVSVPPYAGPLPTVPAHDAVAITVSVTMPTDAGNECQANTFTVPVDVTGTLG